MNVDTVLERVARGPSVFDARRNELVRAGSPGDDDRERDVAPGDRSELAQFMRERGFSQGPDPLTVGEQALLVLHQLSGGSPGYNLRCALAVAPRFEVEHLRSAVRVVTERYDALRSRYLATSCGAFRFLSTGAELAVFEVDGWSSAQCDEWTVDRSMLPFDLERAAPARFDLLINRRGPACDPEAVLVTAFHHVAVDYAAIQILVRELELAYQRIRRGEPTSEGRRPLSSRERVRRELAYLGSAQAERDREFWRRSLESHATELRFRSARERASPPKFLGRQWSRRFGRTLAAKLRGGARTLNATPFTVCLAVFAAVLSRHCETDRLVVGTTVDVDSDRFRHAAVGYYVNTLPIPFVITPDVSLEDLVRTTQRFLGGALAHGQLPFCKLVEHLRIRRDPAVPPVFQTMLTWLRFATDFVRPTEPALLVDVTQPSAVARSGATHDLVLNIVDRLDDMNGCWTFNPDAVHASEVEAVAATFQRALESALDAPIATLHDIVQPLVESAPFRRDRETFDL
jgi:hypothetical protein